VVCYDYLTVNTLEVIISDMASLESPRKEEQLFLEVLQNVLTDPNYLVGTEPGGSGWDFSDWLGYDFKKFGGWVLAEKYFGIPTIDNKMLDLKIVQTDPHEFTVAHAEISFVIIPVKATEFPTILIGKDETGNEVILRNSREPVKMHLVPEYFRSLAQEVGSAAVEESSVVNDSKGNEWALFLKNVLRAKRVLPSHFRPTDFIVRDQLELEAGASYTQEEELLAEMIITEQEILLLAYADFVFTK